MLSCAHQPLRCANVCGGNAQKGSTDVNALMTYVTDIQTAASSQVTISSINKAAKLCTMWSCDI